METSCGVVLVNIDSILLLQYPQGHWDLPKGHVEGADVDRVATVRRELAEETGITEIIFDQDFVERTAYTPIVIKVENERRKCFGSSLKQIPSMLHSHMNTVTTYGWIGNKLLRN